MVAVLLTVTLVAANLTRNLFRRRLAAREGERAALHLAGRAGTELSAVKFRGSSIAASSRLERRNDVEQSRRLPHLVPSRLR